MARQEFIPRREQEIAVEHLSTTPRAALHLPAGMGKTAPTLWAINESLLSMETTRWLVLAPLKVIDTAWRSELAKWTFAEHLTATYLHNLKPHDRKVAANRALRTDIAFVNYEQLKWLVDHYGNRWPFDGLVIDEASKVKDPSTARFKLLRRVASSFERVIELTGSPVAQGLLGLWSQMYLLDNGDALGRSMSAYKQTFFQSDYMGFKWEPREGATEQIQEEIRPLVVSLRQADYMTLPEPLYHTIPVELPTTARHLYQRLEKDWLVELAGEEITAVNAGVMVGKFQQIANGAMYLPDKQGWKDVHDIKLLALEDFIDELQGTPFLLAFHFRCDKERLLDRFGSRGLEIFDGSPEQITRFSEKRIPILGLHPQSAGYGIDGLQYGTNQVVWYGTPWSLEQYEQLNARVIGPRQRGTEFEHSPGMVHHLVAEDTVDTMALDVLQQRDRNQESFLEAMKHRVAEIEQALTGKETE